MQRVLSTCPGQRVPVEGRPPTRVQPTATKAPPATSAPPAPRSLPNTPHPQAPRSPTFKIEHDGLERFRRLFQVPDRRELISPEIDAPPGRVLNMEGMGSQRWPFRDSPAFIVGSSAPNGVAEAYGAAADLSDRASDWHLLGPWHEVVYGIDTHRPSLVDSGRAGVTARLER
jgi:hypothetical protein